MGFGRLFHFRPGNLGTNGDHLPKYIYPFRCFSVRFVSTLNLSKSKAISLSFPIVMVRLSSCFHRLQIQSAGGGPVCGGFDSHTLPPIFHPPCPNSNPWGPLLKPDLSSQSSSDHLHDPMTTWKHDDTRVAAGLIMPWEAATAPSGFRGMTGRRKWEPHWGRLALGEGLCRAFPLSHKASATPWGSMG